MLSFRAILEDAYYIINPANLACLRGELEVGCEEFFNKVIKMGRS
jgi:hypothetical protein